MLAAGYAHGQVAERQERGTPRRPSRNPRLIRSAARLDIVQDRAVVLHRPRGARAVPGVDEAGQVLAAERAGKAARSVSARPLSPRRRQSWNCQVARSGRRAVRSMPITIRGGWRSTAGRAVSWPASVFETMIAQAPAILDDVLVVALGIGRCRWARSPQPAAMIAVIADAEFGAVLRDQHHPVAALQAERGERRRETRHLAGRLGPAGRLPFSSRLVPEEGRVALFLVAARRTSDQIVEPFELYAFPSPQFGRLLPGRPPLRRRYSDGRFGARLHG